jgi:cytidine deaminase
VQTHSVTSSVALPFDERSLVEAARDAAERARSDYYHFKVGAAVLTDDGRVFVAQNIEYSNGAIDHAEEGALQAAANGGAVRILKIAVSGYSVVSDDDAPVLPCGACLQRLSDWARWGGAEILILGTNGSLSKVKRRMVGELLTEAFGAETMKPR